MQSGRGSIMLRTLVLAGLTTLSLATAAHAGGHGTGGKSKAEETPATAPAPAAKKKVVKLSMPRRGRAARRVARRVQGAVVNQSLIRQSWTVADLNPMPALLDLDDTAASLRRATDEIVHLMRR